MDQNWKIFTFNDTLKAARPNVTLLSSVKNTDIGVKYHHAVKGDKATAQDTSNEKEDAKEVRSNRTNGKEVEEKEDEDATKEKTRTKKEEDKNDQELDKGLRVDGEEVKLEIIVMDQSFQRDEQLTVPPNPLITETRLGKRC